MANRDRIKAFSPNETDKTILCLPDICDAEATRSENADTAQGWLYLRDMFVKWLVGRPLSNPTANPEAFLISVEWAMTAKSVSNAMRALRKTILTENAKNAIRSRLRRNNLITDKASTVFDFMLVGDDNM